MRLVAPDHTACRIRLQFYGLDFDHFAYAAHWAVKILVTDELMLASERLPLLLRSALLGGGVEHSELSYDLRDGDFFLHELLVCFDAHTLAQVRPTYAASAVSHGMQVEF